MSSVTAIVLCTDLDDSGIRQVNEWIHGKGFAPLKEQADDSAGTNHPQMDWWTAGYNYFHDEEFVEFFKSVKWDEPAAVVMLMKSEHGHRPAVIFPPDQNAADIPETFT